MLNQFDVARQQNRMNCRFVLTVLESPRDVVNAIYQRRGEILAAHTQEKPIQIDCDEQGTQAEVAFMVSQ